MKNKFSIGELVVVKHKLYPNCNGEYIVASYLSASEFGMRYKGSWINTGHAYLYKLEGFVIKGEYGRELDICGEDDMFKKHEPSQMSFQSLIQSINSPVKQES